MIHLLFKIKKALSGITDIHILFLLGDKEIAVKIRSNSHCRNLKTKVFIKSECLSGHAGHIYVSDRSLLGKWRD